MKTQLIMLETPIIVSDEVINKGDWTITNVTFREDGTDEFEISICNKDVPIKPNKWRKKIIAGIEGLPSIDWNGLEEEFGWVDVEKFIDDFCKNSENVNYENNKDQVHIAFVQRDMAELFKKAQSINEKKFSLEDMEKCFQVATNYGCWLQGGSYDNSDNIDWDDYKKTLQQPKVFDVEVKMVFDGEDKACDDKCEWGQCHSIAECRYVDESVYKPKITNNSIKIIKKL